MPTASDDEGDTATSLLTKTFFLLLFLLPLSVYKSPLKIKSLSPPTAVSAKPQATVAFSKKKSKKKLYVTFDDGPNRGTKNVLHIVQDEGVAVSFFIVGEHVFASPTQSHLWGSLKMTQQIDYATTVSAMPIATMRAITVSRTP